MIYKKNQILTVDIIDVNMMGFGVAKVDDAVFFVQNGVTGDRASVRVIKATKKYYVCRIEELLSASSARTEPKCPVFRRCGGCAFQHVRYELELETKRRFVESCFKKAGISNAVVRSVLSTGEVSGYRNKAQFPFASDEKGNVIAGFFSSRSHKVCAVDRCDIQDQQFSQMMAFVCDYANSKKLTVYNEETGKGLLRHLFLRSGKSTGEVMLCLVVCGMSLPDENGFVTAVTAAFPQIKSIVLNSNTKRTNVILGEDLRVLWGKEKIVDILCDRRLRLSPKSFYQVNHDGAELLYRTGFEMADASQHDLVIDLYCGIGSISLSLPTNSKIVGVEIIPDAVEDANFNAAENGLTSARYFCGDASDAFRILSETGASNPLVIVDPPRKGLSESLIADIASHKIPKVLYISCGADTLARDVKRFLDLGYQMSYVQPVDMFPRTGHVECSVLLCR